jgi:DNA-binding protein HU-beta
MTTECAARKGRNPQTGKAVKIAASKTVKFKPATSLKATLNKKRHPKRPAEGTQISLDPPSRTV